MADGRRGPLGRVVDDDRRLAHFQGRHSGVSLSNAGIDRRRRASSSASTGMGGCSVGRVCSLEACLMCLARRRTGVGGVKALDGALALGSLGEVELDGRARPRARGSSGRRVHFCRRSGSHSRSRVLVAGHLIGVGNFVDVSGPASGERLMLILGGQPGNQSVSRWFITIITRRGVVYLHGRQSIHLRLSQTKLQVHAVGSLFAARRWRAVPDRARKGNKVATNGCVIRSLMTLAL